MIALIKIKRVNEANEKTVYKNKNYKNRIHEDTRKEEEVSEIVRG